MKKVKQRIKDCEYAKGKVKEIVRNFGENYKNEKIGYLQYKTRLNGVLKGKTEEDWIGYYDGEIKRCKDFLKTEDSKNNLVFFVFFLVIFGVFLFLTPNITSYVSLEKLNLENTNLIFGLIVSSLLVIFFIALKRHENSKL